MPARVLILVIAFAFSCTIREGDLPHIAMATSNDSLECVLPYIGVDPVEVTSGTGSGAFHLFAETGTMVTSQIAGGGQLPPLGELTANPPLLDRRADDRQCSAARRRARGVATGDRCGARHDVHDPEAARGVHRGRCHAGRAADPARPHAQCDVRD